MLAGFPVPLERSRSDAADAFLPSRPTSQACQRNWRLAHFAQCRFIQPDILLGGVIPTPVDAHPALLHTLESVAFFLIGINRPTQRQANCVRFFKQKDKARPMIAGPV